MNPRPDPPTCRGNASPARRLALLIGVTVVALSVGPVPVHAATRAPAPGRSVTLSVQGIDPVSPVPSRTNTQLAVTLAVTNRGPAAVDDVRIVGERGYPITTPAQLAASMASSVTAAANDLPVTPVRPVTVSVAAGATTTVVFRTTTSIQNDAGVCACQDVVYPLLFSAVATDAGATDVTLGSARTYLPLFVHPPTKLQVTWIWPLLDRPHRLTSDTVFEDDDLATSVRTGGRLDRALAVVEQADPGTPLTLVLDPEIVDELQVMATGYTVRSRARATPSQGKPATVDPTVAGTGRDAAGAWLARLRTVLQQRPADEAVFTPWADPDVQTLASRGRSWSVSLPRPMAQRIATALGDGVSPRTDLAWPAASRIGPRTVTALARTGVRTVVLDSAGVSTGSTTSTGPSGATQLTGRSPVTALLTDPGIEKLIDAAVVRGSNGMAGLPILTAALATRVTSTPDAGRVTVLTVPRYVDASVPDAVRTIDTVAQAAFVAPTALSHVVGPADTPSTTGTLRTVPETQAVLHDSVSTGIATIRSTTTSLQSLLRVDAVTARRAGATQQAAAQQTLDALPLAVQRLKSSAWRADSGVAASIADSFGASAHAYVEHITQGVHIVTPSTGAYTLASKNSDLPVTVQNTLSFPVSIVLDVSTVNGVPGFSTKDLGTQTVVAGGTRTFHIPTTVQRSGRIQIEVSLGTPDNTRLGKTLLLTVHSTALGRIGVIITIVAGALLVLAFFVRTVRWLRRRASRTAASATAGAGT